MSLYHSLLIFCLLLCTYVNLHGQYYIEKHYQSHLINGNQLLITTDGGLIEIEAWNESMIRVGFHKDYKADLMTTPSVNMVQLPVKTKISTAPGTLTYETDSMSIVINKSPLLMEYYRNGKLLLKDTLFGFFYYEVHEYHGIKFAIETNENIYGSGSQAQSINRRNFKKTFNQTNHWGYEWENENNLNFAVPFFISSKNYGLYMDSHSRALLDIDLSNKNVLSYNSIHNKFSFFLMSGENTSDVFLQYTALTGRQPLPPRWSLGFILSKAYYYTEDELFTAVNDMKQADYPIDALVLDATWYDEMGDLTWSPKNFPNYKTFLKEYENDGIRIIPISHMYISKYSKHYDFLHNSRLICSDSNLLPLYCRIQERDSFLLYDLTNPETLQYFWNLYKEQVTAGVAGWWCDCGEPDIYPGETIHYNGKSSYVMKNLINFLWLKMLYDGNKKDFPELRPFFMTRSGWAGAQRFGAFPLCGDEARSWLGLKAMIPVMLGASMSGISYLHSDIGGFAPLHNFRNNELYLRWYQLGTFSPIMRTHTVIPVPSEPCYYDLNMQKTLKELSQLRYKFLPYNYTLSYHNSISGLPLIKPINYYELENSDLGNINDEFLWGEHFLVAPVVDSVFNRTIYFPSGKWIDWFTGEVFNGNTNYKINVPLEKLPLYVRSGAIIPTALEMKNTNSYKADSLVFYYFPDTAVKTSSFRMFNDDGRDPESLEKGLYEFIDTKADCYINEIFFNINHTLTNKEYSAPDKRDISVCMKNIPFRPGSLKLNDRRMKIESSFAMVQPKDNYAVYLEKKNELWVHFTWLNDSTTIWLSDIVDSIDQPSDLFYSIFDNFYPNPFSEFSTLKYFLNSPDDLEFILYDLLGKTIGNWEIAHNKSGSFEFVFDGNDNTGMQLSPGIYLLFIKSKENGQFEHRTLFKIR